MPTGIDPESADPRLLEAAEAVAEGGAVDWASQAATSPELAGALEELQMLAQMHGALRALDGAAGTPEREVRFRWGDLEALEKLGEGHSGEVWCAWDPALEREVALKLAHPGERRSNALEEARRLARVRHPNVLAIHGVDVRDGRAGLWMEKLEGSTLEQLLASQGALGAREAAGVGIELCRALAAIHATGLVHGDVTTRNVMRERGGRIVLMDLGSGAISGDVALGSITGTPLSSAPELLAGAAPDARADLYALAVLLYRLVSAEYPVAADSIDALRAAHAAGQRRSLRSARPDLPAGFVAAVEHGLEADPARRYPDAGAFEAALAGAMAPAMTAGVLAASVPTRSRKLQAWTAGALVIATVIALLVWIGRPREAATPTSITQDPVASANPNLAVVPAPANTIAPALPPGIAALEFLRGREGTAEAVHSGALVRVGDELWMRMTTREAAYVYVFNEDDAGQVHALFPVSGTSQGNPLKPGAKHELPGARDGETLHWQVSSPAGRERFLVIASRKPLAAVERAVAALAPASSDAPLTYAPVNDTLIAALRGVGRMRPATPMRESSGKLDALVAELSMTDGVWLRRYELVHEVR